MAATFAVLFLQVVRPFALPLFLAAVFAVMVMPLHERIAARCGGRGWLSALLITVTLALLLLGPTTAGFLVSCRRAGDAVALLGRAAREPGLHDRLFGRLARLTQSDPEELRTRAIDALREGEQLLFRRTIQAVGNVFSFGLGVLLFLIAGFFFLKDGRSIVEAWEELTPLDLDQDRQIRREFAVVCRAVVSSTLLAALAQASAFGL
jgi:predicted PurR-regulated permease PerM